MKPLIGVIGTRGRSHRHNGLPIFLQNRAYIHALAVAGAAPVAIPLELGTETLRAIYERLDGILLCGGGDVHPAQYGERPHEKLGETDAERDRVEMLLSRWALAEAKPILGICRGVQALNVAAGGTLYQDIAAQRVGSLKHDYYPAYPRNHLSHRIATVPGSRMARLIGREAMVNSMHHQAIKDLAPGFVATAHAEDGIIEAIEHQTHPYAVGVQWHPEELAPKDPAMHALFVSFAEAAMAR